VVRVRRFSDAKYIVTLTPASEASSATITIREKRRRGGYAVTLGSLYVILAMREADNARAAKRKKRTKLSVL
jgi:hypothetical protein